MDGIYIDFESFVDVYGSVTAITSVSIIQY